MQPRPFLVCFSFDTPLFSAACHDDLPAPPKAVGVHRRPGHSRCDVFVYQGDRQQQVSGADVPRHKGRQDGGRQRRSSGGTETRTCSNSPLFFTWHHIVLSCCLQFYIRRWTEETAEALPGAMPRVEAPAALPEPMLGATARAWVVRRWNEVSFVQCIAIAASVSP